MLRPEGRSTLENREHQIANPRSRTHTIGLVKPHYEAKAVFNQHGIIFLPVNQQHRDRKAENISYEDNYQGNALAAMLYPKRIEIRYHEAFSDTEVAELLNDLGTQRELCFMLGWSATYQGRQVERSQRRVIEAQLGHLLDESQPTLQPVLDRAFPHGGYSFLRELIEAAEYGVALEVFCDQLAEFGISIDTGQAERIRLLAEAMNIDAERILQGVPVLAENTRE